MELATYYLFELDLPLDDLVDAISKIESDGKPKYDFVGDFEYVDSDSGEQLLKGACFARQDVRKPPTWYGLFRSLTDEQLNDRFSGSSHSGIIAADAHGRRWGISFGHSYRDVEELGVEMRFGRIGISNAIDDEEALRGFVAQTFGSNAKVRIETTNRDGPLDRLAFLEQSNRLRKLRARVEFDGDEFTVEGGVGFKFARPNDADQLIAILEQLLTWWNSGVELRPEIAEKDPVWEIVDSKRKDTYEAEYEDALVNGPDTGFFVSFDLAELWTAQSYGLKIGRDRVADLAMPDTDICLAQVRKFLGKETDEHKLRLEFDLPTGSQTRRVREVISFERPQQAGEPFVAVRDEGRWWEYRSVWVKGIDENLARCFSRCEVTKKNLEGQLSKFVRASYGKSDPEGEWSAAQAKNLNGKLLHKVSVIKVANSKSGFELADIYLPGDIFLHVKRGDGLAQIDEVAGQGESAARMLVRDPDFSSKASALLQKLEVVQDFSNRQGITIGCVTICHNPKLSIRAKERIVNYFRKINDFGFEPLWAFVDAGP
jgi:uncharacterized protein (TIGR04141 family)